MTDYYIELQNVDVTGDGSTDNIQYHFDLIQNLSDEGEIPFTVIEADQAINNQALGFSGKARRIPLEWILYDNGEDKADSTFPGTVDSRISGSVTTIEEQIVYLRRYIQNSTLGARWRLYGGKFSDPDGDGSDEGTPVALESLNVRRSARRANRANGSIRLKVAQVV